MLNFGYKFGIIMHLIGRLHQKERLQKLVNSLQSEFVVLYGRRRTGKTFLVREFFNHNFTFYTSGLNDERLDIQLSHFIASLKHHPNYDEDTMPTNWMEAFRQLIKTLEKDKSAQKIIFIDELPWMDTPNSDLKVALDMFWNTWASARKDIKLIICGSSASWIINTFINNDGAFYNRATEVIKLSPFTLGETKEYLLAKGIEYDDYQIVTLYMVLGGIPFYLNKLERGFSAFQNIDRLLFGKKAIIKDEYELLFKSLFKNYQKHIDIIDVLAKKKMGMYRAEITAALKLKDGGSFSTILSELEAADFIKTYSIPKSTKKNVLYKVADQYILFYKNFIEKHQKTENYWASNANTPLWYSWASLAFELTCYNHIDLIKKALGIASVQSDTYMWANAAAQIDLIIDRKDRIINLLEIKFSEKPFTVTKEYEKEMHKKLTAYQAEYPSKKATWFVLFTTYGLQSYTNAAIFQNVLTMEVLFE